MQGEPLGSAPEKDLRAYIATVRHHKWEIGAITLLTVLATLIFTTRQTPVYSSEARVLVRPAVPGTTSAVSVETIDMPTERGISQSSVVADLVKKNLNLSESTDSLLSNLAVDIEPETFFLVMHYSDPDPARAQRIAQGFADAYLDNRKSAADEEIQSQKDALNAQKKEYEATATRLEREIHSARPTQNVTPQSDELTFTLLRIGAIESQLLGLQTSPGYGGSVFQPADLPTTPSSPSYPRNLALAAIIGLAMGSGIAFLREHLNEGLRGSGDLEEQVQAPVLAAIPHLMSWRRRDRTQLTALESPKGPIAEAYRTLRTNLQFVARDGDFRILSVTSPTLGEGKTTTVANLAATLAQVDKRVIAVSCDLRKPRLHRFFDLSNDVGVSTILAGKTTLAEASQAPAGIETLRVLASGPIPSNPAEILGSEEMDRFIEDLRQFADFVVIDTPPVLAVADALIVGPKSDGVIVIADAHATSRGAAAHTREQLEQVGVNIVGCVFNNFDPTQAKYYPYDNRYYYSSYAYNDKEYIQGPQPAGNGHGDSKAAEEIWG